ncbi:MAG: hypothetical protein DCC55_27485 [Chloroflexi bacterium]|nr:MAG: hypothetical protein DCC55_27485 [Chloroflexota bacterium]
MTRACSSCRTALAYCSNL